MVPKALREFYLEAFHDQLGHVGRDRTHALMARFLYWPGLSKDVAEHKVVVYMKGVPDMPQCSFSNAVVQVMKAEGVAFKGFNVLADPDFEQFNNRSGF